MINRLNIQKDLSKITVSVLKAVTNILNNANVKTSPSEAKKKFSVTIDNRQIDLVLPSYYIYVEKGRKRGERPPVKPIIRWIKQNRIAIPEGSTILGFAFAISNSIAKNGIKPRPFIEDVQEEIAFITRDYFVSKINKFLE